MKEYLDRYEKYNNRMEEYKGKRKALLKDPEEQLHEMAEELDIYRLRRSVAEDFKELGVVANNIYKNIWSGDPNISDIDEFLSIVDTLMQYEEFVSAEELKKWQAARNVVEAFGKTYKKTEEGDGLIS